MPEQELSIGVKFTQEGAEGISSAFDAAMKRIDQRTQETSGNIGSAFEAAMRRVESKGRVGYDAPIGPQLPIGYDSPIGPTDERGKAKAAAKAILETAAALREQRQAAQDAKPPIVAHYEALKESGEEAKSAEGKHNELKSALKGLALEFPLLARVMGLLQNPLAGTIAVVGTLIGLIKGYATSVAEAGMAARGPLEEMYGQVQNLATVQEELATQTDAFRKNLEAVATAADTATGKLNEWNTALLLKQQLEQELGDAELDKELADVDSRGDLTDAQKIQARATANQKARRRKEDRSLDTLQQQGQDAGMAALLATNRRNNATERAEAMQDEVDRREHAARAAGGEAGSIESLNAPRRKQNEETLEFVRQLRQKGGTSVGDMFGQAGAALLSPGKYAELKKRFGNVSSDGKLEDIETQLINENKTFDLQRQTAEKNAAQKKRAADKLKAEQAALQAEATQAEQDRVTAEKTSRDKFFEFGQRGAARSKREPITTAAENTRTQKSVGEAEDREVRELQREVDEAYERARRDAERSARGNDQGSTSSAVDLSPLSDAAQSTDEVASAIVSLAEKTTAAQGGTVARLAQLERIVGDQGHRFGRNDVMGA